MTQISRSSQRTGMKSSPLSPSRLPAPSALVASMQQDLWLHAKRRSCRTQAPYQVSDVGLVWLQSLSVSRITCTSPSRTKTHQSKKQKGNAVHPSKKGMQIPHAAGTILPPKPALSRQHANREPNVHATPTCASKTGFNKWIQTLFNSLSSLFDYKCLIQNQSKSSIATITCLSCSGLSNMRGFMQFTLLTVTSASNTALTS